MQLPEQQNKLLICLLAIVVTFLTACSNAQAADALAEEKWLTSAHADKTSASFTAWDPAQIPENCARCHSTPGYRDFLGLDGATAGQVDQPAPIGTTVECAACHNKVAGNKDTSLQPSGIELTGLGGNATCLDCHQGRAAGNSIDEAIGDLDDDTVNADLRFPNVHNNPAGPLQYGVEAHGGYEYKGRQYAGRYDHVLQFETCVACHDAHALTVDAQKCSVCHLGITSPDDLAEIRVSNTDYDGDGNTEESLAGEIDTLRERLLLAIRLYARTTEGLDDIVFKDTRPYFFDPSGESYATWTPRLLRAAYNYHYATKGIGSYAHNAPYTIQLLSDSLDDLGAGIFPIRRPASE